MPETKPRYAGSKLDLEDIVERNSKELGVGASCCSVLELVSARGSVLVPGRGEGGGESHHSFASPASSWSMAE